MISISRRARTSLHPAALLAFFLLACGKTPLDVLEAASTGAGGQSCASAPAALAGSYRIRSLSSGKCLAIGGAITVNGFPALLTAMVDDCSAQGEVYQLIPDGGFSSFQLRATNGDNVDVETAATADGTRVIYFTPNGLKNQRFTFSARAERVFAMVPAHAPTSCVTEVSPEPQIFACDSAQSNQEWELLPASCD
ncbi:MAG: RICIN domain-containing protein [Polyangiaceae bacterium]